MESKIKMFRENPTRFKSGNGNLLNIFILKSVYFQIHYPVQSDLIYYLYRLWKMIQ